MRAMIAQWLRLAEEMTGLRVASAGALQDTTRADPPLFAEASRDHLVEGQQRGLTTADTQRRTATAATARDEAGLKPVLAFDRDVVIDVADPDPPVDCSLVRIRPPEAGHATRPDLRPRAPSGTTPRSVAFSAMPGHEVVSTRSATAQQPFRNPGAGLVLQEEKTRPRPENVAGAGAARGHLASVSNLTVASLPILRPRAPRASGLATPRPR